MTHVLYSRIPHSDKRKTLLPEVFHSGLAFIQWNWFNVYEKDGNMQSKIRLNGLLVGSCTKPHVHSRNRHLYAETSVNFASVDLQSQEYRLLWAATFSAEGWAEMRRMLTGEGSFSAHFYLGCISLSEEHRHSMLVMKMRGGRTSENVAVERNAANGRAGMAG